MGKKRERQSYSGWTPDQFPIAFHAALREGGGLIPYGNHTPETIRVMWYRFLKILGAMHDHPLKVFLQGDIQTIRTTRGLKITFNEKRERLDTVAILNRAFSQDGN